MAQTHILDGAEALTPGYSGEFWLLEVGGEMNARGRPFLPFIPKLLDYVIVDRKAALLGKSHAGHFL